MGLTVKLIAPKGLTSFNHAGTEYKATKKGEVEVPSHLVEMLIGGHGFALPGAQQASAADTGGNANSSTAPQGETGPAVPWAKE